MPELVRARTRVDAETVAPERRTPAVPITRFSYDRSAMRDARLARNRIATPAATPERSGPIFVDVLSAYPTPAALGSAPTSAAQPLGVRSAARAIGEPDPADEPERVPASGRSGASEPVGDEPIAVFTCIAEYPTSFPVRTSILSAPSPATDAATPRRSPAVRASSPAPVVPEDDRRPPTDHVRARAEAAAADARLRAVALAQRAARLHDRLADQPPAAAIDLSDATSAARTTARRRRFARR
ncbi:MAG: hypothetical protein R2726_13595 [Acidimicrobiales bacterium]